MSTRGQGHCLTFVKVHSGLYVQTSVPRLLDRSKSNFMIGEQNCSNDVDHMTKIAAMSINGYFLFFIIIFFFFSFF